MRIHPAGIETWQDFFLAQIGASAALLGLLFVGVSLNLARILSVPLPPGRAMLALLLLLGVLVAGFLVLIPGLPPMLLGAGMLLIGATLSWAAVGVSFALRRGALAAGPVIALNLLLTALSTLPYLVAAGLLFRGDMAALYWIATGMIVSVIKSVADAWVLLVEINR